MSKIYKEDDVMRINPQRPLTENEQRSIKQLKSSGDNFYYEIIDYVSDCPERTIALTKLEEAVMWAIKGLTK